jgi:hypothetical protein
MKERVLKKLSLLCLTALITISISLAASAARRTSTIKIINQSKWEIHELYLSPSSSRHWGPDQLGDQVLEKGESITLRNLACNHYDIRVVDEDGDECVMENEELCGDNAFWKITDKKLLACEEASEER